VDVCVCGRVCVDVCVWTCVCGRVVAYRLMDLYLTCPDYQLCSLHVNVSGTTRHATHAPDVRNRVLCRRLEIVCRLQRR